MPLRREPSDYLQDGNPLSLDGLGGTLVNELGNADGLGGGYDPGELRFFEVFLAHTPSPLGGFTSL